MARPCARLPEMAACHFHVAMSSGPVDSLQIWGTHRKYSMLLANPRNRAAWCWLTVLGNTTSSFVRQQRHRSSLSNVPNSVYFSPKDLVCPPRPSSSSNRLLLASIPFLLPHRHVQYLCQGVVETHNTILLIIKCHGLGVTRSSSCCHIATTSNDFFMRTDTVT